MSQENIETLRASNSAFNRGDWGGAFAMYDPDIEFRALRHPPDLPEVFRGLDAVRLVLSKWSEVYEEFAAEVHKFIDAGAWVLCDTRWHGRGKGSAIPIDARGIDAYEFSDGRIVRVVIGYPDLPTALKAAGLEE